MELRRSYKNSTQIYSYFIRNDKRLSEEKYKRLYDILERYKGKRINIKILLDCIITSLNGFPDYLHIIFEEKDAEKTDVVFTNGILLHYKSTVNFTGERVLVFDCDIDGQIKISGKNIDPKNANRKIIDLVNYFYDQEIEILSYLKNFEQRTINPQQK